LIEGTEATALAAGSLVEAMSSHPESPEFRHTINYLSSAQFGQSTQMLSNSCLREIRSVNRNCQRNVKSHLIADVPCRPARVEMTISIDLGDVWSHYCTLNEKEKRSIAAASEPVPRESLIFLR